MNQQEFLQQIKDIVPPNVNVTAEMADVLGLANDGIYRRMRGSTQLTYDELVRLCRHFKISFDSVAGIEGGTVTFEYASIGNKDDSFEKYLLNLNQKLKYFQSVPNTKAVFAAEDIPLFHYFAFENLTAFKIYFWQKSVLRVPSREDGKYSFPAVKKETIAVAKQTLEIYNNLDCTEIWCEDTVNGTLKQIEFFYEAGLFENKEDVLKICEEVKQMLGHIQTQAEKKVKFFPGQKSIANENNFTLYGSDVMIGCNTIWVELPSKLPNMPGTQVSIISPFTFSSMQTTNVNFGNDTKNWLDSLIKKSALFSGSSEKARTQFFSRSIEMVNRFAMKIK